jgi:hypothetical protein
MTAGDATGTGEQMKPVGPVWWLRGAAWWALLALPAGLLGGETPRYRGFIIDDSRVQNMPNLEAVRAATKEQIDMVCAVGVPAEILAFFQGVPFEIIPQGVMPSGTPGLYSPRDRSVRVTAGIVTTGHKPVLLHELLHAYHDQRLPGGVENPDIARFYERAKAIPAYARKSHMMQNDREFFACSATTYLFGVTAQEPFKREKLRDNQPDFLDYLKKLFGSNAGEYQGSLTRPPNEEKAPPAKGTSATQTPE